MYNYFWRKGLKLTFREFSDLIKNNKSFYDDLADAYSVDETFCKLSMLEKCNYLAKEYFSYNRWYWAWCFDTKTISIYKWGSAYQHVFDSLTKKLYVETYFTKRSKISCGSDEDIIAFGKDFKNFEIK